MAIVEVEGPCYRKKVFEEWEYVCVKGLGISADRMQLYMCLECSHQCSSMKLLVGHCKSLHQTYIKGVKTGRHSPDEYVELDCETLDTGKHFQGKHIADVKREDLSYKMLKALEPSPVITSRRSKKHLMENIVKAEEARARHALEKVRKLEEKVRRQDRSAGSKDPGEAEEQAQNFLKAEQTRERAERKLLKADQEIELANDEIRRGIEKLRMQARRNTRDPGEQEADREAGDEEEDAIEADEQGSPEEEKDNEEEHTDELVGERRTKSRGLTHYSSEEIDNELEHLAESPKINLLPDGNAAVLVRSPKPKGTVEKVVHVGPEQTETKDEVLNFEEVGEKQPMAEKYLSPVKDAFLTIRNFYNKLRAEEEAELHSLLMTILDEGVMHTGIDSAMQAAKELKVRWAQMQCELSTLKEAIVTQTVNYSKQERLRDNEKLYAEIQSQLETTKRSSKDIENKLSELEESQRFASKERQQLIEEKHDQDMEQEMKRQTITKESQKLKQELQLAEQKISQVYEVSTILDLGPESRR